MIFVDVPRDVFRPVTPCWLRMADLPHLSTDKVFPSGLNHEKPVQTENTKNHCLIKQVFEGKTHIDIESSGLGQTCGQTRNQENHCYHH